jgi:hypothetical protein
MRAVRGKVYIARKILPSDYATIVRDYARSNLDEAELWEGLTALGYNSFEIGWHVANPGRRLEVRGSRMDEELKNLFFSAIDNFPLERQDAAQRWLKERVVLAKVAEQLIAEAGAEFPAELQ